jgi:hypothetical protein
VGDDFFEVSSDPESEYFNYFFEQLDINQGFFNVNVQGRSNSSSTWSVRVYYPHLRNGVVEEYREYQIGITETEIAGEVTFYVPVQV